MDSEQLHAAFMQLSEETIAALEADAKESLARALALHAQAKQEGSSPEAVERLRRDLAALLAEQKKRADEHLRTYRARLKLLTVSDPAVTRYPS